MSERSTTPRPRSRLMRGRRDGEQRVTNTELFFDLVYVFAITQTTAFLGEHLDWPGALHALLLLFALWWAWVYTAWMTNWLHPDVRIVRAVLLLVMLASLIVAAVLPEAFGERSLVFAVTYVVLQLGRTGFVVLALWREPVLRQNFERIAIWLTCSGACWLAGAFVGGTGRDALWLAAVVIDFVAPASGFAVPLMGRSTTADWNIAGDHLAERCQLFVIIVLGESILDIGVSLGEGEFSTARVAAFVVAFVVTVALWWVYFDRSAEDSSKTIATSADPGRLGRSAYTYFHLPMVAGVIVTAVADERVIAHPTGDGSPAVTAVLLAGPGLFLFGHLLFKRAVFGTLSWPRVAGLVVLAALVPLGAVVSPLALAAISGAVLVGVAVTDLILYPGHGPVAQPG